MIVRNVILKSRDEAKDLPSAQSSGVRGLHRLRKTRCLVGQAPWQVLRCAQNDIRPRVACALLADSSGRCNGNRLLKPEDADCQTWRQLAPVASQRRGAVALASIGADDAQRGGGGRWCSR
jgi:hypothetical protein